MDSRLIVQHVRFFYVPAGMTIYYLCAKFKLVGKANL